MYKSLKDIPNPYQPNQEIKSESFFIGRKEEIDLISNKIEESVNSGLKKNFIIIGDKSIGKSSLLHIIRSKLALKDYLPVYFSINQSKIISSIIFFKELIDTILYEGAPNSLLNKKKGSDEFTQLEIWEALTLYGEHSSGPNQRDILLASFYAEALNKNKFEHPLSEMYLIRDFEYINNSVKECGYKSLVIMIDEFQMLKENDNIIQMILSLIETDINIKFILCGNEFLKSDSFEKIMRKVEPIELRPLNKNDVHDLIYKPLMHYGFTREEVNEYICTKSIKFLSKSYEINPFYLNLILYEMFERFKNGITKKIEFTHDVSIAIMDKLKFNAPHHEKITAQLNVADHNQLEALKRIYPFQNLNLDDIVLVNMAFKEYSNNTYNDYLLELIADIELVSSLQLFKFHLPHNITLDSLFENPEISRNDAANIKFKFIGDAVDELFLASYINNALDQELKISHFKDANGFLSAQLDRHLIKKIAEYLKINNSGEISVHGSIKQIEKAKEQELTSNQIEKKVNILNQSNKENLNADDHKNIQESLENTSLEILPFLNQIFNYSDGYYFIFIKAKIRDKIFIFEYLIPYDIGTDYTPLYTNDSFNISEFKHYKVEILEGIITKIKPTVVGVLSYIDLNSLYVFLQRSVYSGRYEDALKVLEILKHYYDDLDTYHNNSGFVNILRKELNISEKCFKLVKKQNYTTLVNQSYLHYLNNNLHMVKQLIKTAEKSIKKLKPEDGTFLAIHQILVPLSVRQQIKEVVFDLTFNVSIDLIMQGNQAILASMEKQNHCFNILDRAKIETEQDKFYKSRYEYFLHYNLGEYEKARERILKAEEELPEVNIVEHLKELLDIDKKLIL